MKNIIRNFINFILIVICLIVFSCGCKKAEPAFVKTEEERLSVIATLFPQYDFARAVAGELADVSLLLPPGVDIHTFDPGYSAVSAISKADMFIYTGDGFEPWAKKLLDGVKSQKITVVVAGVGSSHKENKHNGHENEGSAHIWLDLLDAVKMVENIRDAFCEVDFVNAEVYKGNAGEYIDKLKLLDERIISAVENGKRNTVVFGGRFAYEVFLNRYGLEYRSVYSSCGDEVEPGLAAVNGVVKFIKEKNIPVVFYEELSVHKIADSIAAQTGAKALLFHSCHNLSKGELDAGVTFIELMERNLENLIVALN